MIREMRTHARAAAIAAALTVVPALASAQTSEMPKPGFNLFSIEQEMQLGQQAARDAERQLPLLSDRSVSDYANRIVQELARTAPGHRYPYQIKVVNASDINAFALPGGYMYVNRGLIQAVRTEGELAGVLAHEMAHVALRHGTHQVSKAYATQAGLGVLGGLLGIGNGRSLGDQVLNVFGQVGLMALFNKFSRDAEYQADLVGARMMHAAGWSPNDMSSFFDLLQSQRSRNPGAVESFFASHPPPADRSTRIRRETQALGAVPGRTLGGLNAAQQELRGLGPAPTMEQIARGQAPSGQPRPPTYRGRVSVERPSTRYRTFDHARGYFSLNYPDNWRVYQGNDGFAVTLAPDGGAVQDAGGNTSLIYAVIVNHYDPFDSASARGRNTLEAATNDIVAQVRSSNPHLRLVRNSQRRQNLDGAPALSVVLAGRSPVTGEEERVTAFTRELEDGHVLYALFIAPGRDYNVFSPAFQRIVGSLRVNDRSVHR
jgi:Zn-dependent protease with chaperone function